MLQKLNKYFSELVISRECLACINTQCFKYITLYDLCIESIYILNK